MVLEVGRPIDFGELRKELIGEGEQTEYVDENELFEFLWSLHIYYYVACEKYVTQSTHNQK